MALLKTEPPGPVRSLGELFAIAHRLECDAAAHYSEIAARLRGAGNPDAAAVFELLAGEKRVRALDVERWSRERTGTAPDPAVARWKPQGMLGGEGGDGDASLRLANAYRALSLAVEHRERAFVFWSYVVAQAGDPAVRQAAAALAEEELRRASVLRRERRRAFHAQRLAPRGTGDRRTFADDPQHGPASGVASVERELAMRLRELAAASAARGDESEAHSLRRMAEEAEGLAREVETARTVVASAGQDLSIPAEAFDDEGASLRTALRLAELATERYLAAAGATKDEAAMLQAQSLAERAIARSARLGRLWG